MKIFNCLIICLCPIFLTSASKSLAQEQFKLGCEVLNLITHVRISFAGPLNITDLENYADKGNLPVTAEISGNGNSHSVSTTMRYKKIGSRLEFTQPQFEGAHLQVSMDEFKKQFGLFPILSCSSQ